MKNITEKPTTSIKNAMKKLSKSGFKTLVIIDKNKKLLGTLSDGDLRKAILKGVSVNNSISDIYQKTPTFYKINKYKIEDAKKIFTKNKFDVIPIVDNKGTFLKVLSWEAAFKNSNKKKANSISASVVIMAGGKGTRLQPFTNILPKPLIPIKGKPVIEHILESFINAGVSNFYITVNYKAKIMKAFFQEMNPDYSINYIEEEKPLGTAGSLKYLDKKLKEPFIVSNCDIIVKIDYSDLYKFHKKNNYDITLVASMKNYIIPYGTCELNEEGYLKSINEKPQYDFLINTGLYVLNPKILELLPKNKFYHITDLIQNAQKNGKKIGVYPTDDEDWIDVGEWTEYQNAIRVLK